MVMNADAETPRKGTPTDREAFDALALRANLEDKPDSPLADAVLKAGKETEGFRYFISVGRVAYFAQKKGTEAARAASVVSQAEMAPDHLGVGVILRHSEAFAAWGEGKWDPPASEAAPNAALEARRIAVLAFIADVRTEIAARGGRA